MNLTKNIGLVVAIVVALIVLGVTSWQLNWFIKEKNVDRRTELIDNSIGRQQAIASKIQRDVVTIRNIDAQEQTPEVQAQRRALTDDVCQNASLLTGSVTLSGSVETFIYEECS